MGGKLTLISNHRKQYDLVREPIYLSCSEDFLQDNDQPEHVHLNRGHVYIVEKHQDDKINKNSVINKHK